MEAVSRSPEEASRFISRKCVYTIDLAELRSVFEHGGYKCLSSNIGAKCGTHTVLIFDRAENEKIVLRLYMVREPDRYGQWKIFNVVRE
jgi:hypothetical protein